ncbi:MAG: radical SAM protein [Lachnospiraceae bacterium]|nr:radical SAM protein [bacterium]MDY5517843.1 radical SAM protein [Lachnospiraceae bacterium]
MDWLEQTDEIEERLVKKASAARIPIGGTIELSPACNMGCEMCYARMDMAHIKEQGGLLSGERWMELAEQLQEAGCMFLLLTGGEPLLYPDFKKVYTGLQQMGFILTLNTNGTLINEEWADFFAAHPPRRINITVYGTDDQVYESLCHYREGYERTIRGIRLLRERGLAVKMNVSLTRKNKEQFQQFYELARTLGVPIEVDSYMFPFCREQKAYDETVRLTPQECADHYMQAMYRQNPAGFQSYVRDAGAVLNGVRFAGHEGMICRAGISSFWINWKGKLSPCFAMQTDEISLETHRFLDAWQLLGERVASVRLSDSCIHCQWQKVCPSCAGRALCETGRADGTPEYLCSFMECIKKGFHEV